MAILKKPIGPGKTPPRLIADLLDYVPKPVRNGFNLLADPAQQFRNQRVIRKEKNDCTHKLVRKERQTKAPESGNVEIDHSSHFVVAAICSTCKHHFKISVFSDFNGDDEPCSLVKHNYPLHHLISTYSSGACDQLLSSEKSKYRDLSEIYQYRCSAPRCPIVVKISITLPRLSTNLLQPIDDEETLEKRGNLEIQKDPTRFTGQEPANPLTALVNLKTYLTDALNSPNEPRKIAVLNKKFRLSYADDCRELFEYLDFEFIEGEVEGDDSNSYWRLPMVSDLNRDFLEDALLEINLRIIEKQVENNIPPPMSNYVSAMNQIKAILGYDGYPETTRYFDDEAKEEHPYYSSLGAVSHFSDELLSWAYDRQCECDPENKPYYLDCLEDLAHGRKSDDLQTKFVIISSAGNYGRKALEDAYKFFGLDYGTQVSDETIMEIFKSRVYPTPKLKDDARSCLKIIARHRNSLSIESLANEKTMNFEEALEFLGVGTDTSPEFIEAAAIAMFADGDKSKVARALQIISKHRPGNMLLLRAAFTMTSEAGEQALSVDEAYQRLQISSNGISDEGILNYYQSLSNRASESSIESYTEALRVIALSRNSYFLLARLEGTEVDVPSDSIEPAGLDNIGNTCYLNSLLQYYYTVKPVREMIMNFDNYRMELNDENLRKKKVGGRQIETAEIIKAQKFVDEMRQLFTSLKKSPTRSVRPSKELAALTIFSTQAEQAAQKSSLSSASDRPNVTQNEEATRKCPFKSVNDRSNKIKYGEAAVNVPFWTENWPPSVPPSAENDVEMVAYQNDIDFSKCDNSSETTLIDDFFFNSERQTINEQLSLSGLEYEEIPKNERNANPDVDVTMGNSLPLEMTNDAPPGPDRPPPVPPPSLPPPPPPVPPRNKSGLVISTSGSKDVDSVDRIWDFGSQQDVTEVIGNVLFRLQCAITATGFEESSGEQIDVIRESFFGANTVYTQKMHYLQKKIEAWSYLLVFPARNIPRSIYEALDVSFDEQIVEVDNQYVPQYTSISKLPRIMQFHIQRTAFDQESLQSWKNRTPVTIPETLYLDRYMDDSDKVDPVIMRRRRETWKWKRQLKLLEARYNFLTHAESSINVPEALVATREWINDMQELEVEGVPVDPDLVDILETRIAEVAHELNKVNGKIETLRQKLKNQFTDMREYEYKLHAVFIHHGEAGGGHYWVYIYDSEQDTWREYNDEYVTQVRNRDFIFNHESVGGGTPYYVVYVRSSELKELIDPVCREVQVIEAPSTSQRLDLISEQKDIEMKEVRHVEHAHKGLPESKSVVSTPCEHW